MFRIPPPGRMDTNYRTVWYVVLVQNLCVVHADVDVLFWHPACMPAEPEDRAGADILDIMYVQGGRYTVTVLTYYVTDSRQQDSRFSTCSVSTLARQQIEKHAIPSNPSRLQLVSLSLYYEESYYHAT
jgi:hypothetical protein